MKRYLGIEILDLDGYSRKFVHELSEGLVVFLSLIGQGGRGHAVRPVTDDLCTESFDKGVEAVYAPR